MADYDQILLFMMTDLKSLRNSLRLYLLIHIGFDRDSLYGILTGAVLDAHRYHGMKTVSRRFTADTLIPDLIIIVERLMRSVQLRPALFIKEKYRICISTMKLRPVSF